MVARDANDTPGLPLVFPTEKFFADPVITHRWEGKQDPRTK